MNSLQKGTYWDLRNTTSVAGQHRVSTRTIEQRQEDEVEVWLTNVLWRQKWAGPWNPEGICDRSRR